MLTPEEKKLCAEYMGIKGVTVKKIKKILITFNVLVLVVNIFLSMASENFTATFAWFCALLGLLVYIAHEEEKQ